MEASRQVGDFRIGEPIRGGVAGARYRGEEIHTGAPVIITRLPPDMAERAARARQILDLLNTQKPPPRAAPRVLAHELESDGAAVLVLGDFPGDALAAHLLRSGSGRLAETTALTIAFQHASLLRALHGAGHSGLAPSIDEAWWDETSGRLTVLGWGEVHEGLEQVAADMAAAAALLHQLVLGTPAPVRSSVSLGKHPAWESLSLGTRRILQRALHPDRGHRYPSAEALWLQLSAHLDRLRRAPDELLGEGRRLMQNDPETATVVLDLARRATPPPEGAEILFRQAWEAIAGQGERAFRAGQAELELIQYTAAARAFERAALACEAQPDERLRARRWQLVAAAGSLAAEKIVSYSDHLPALRQALELAELGQWADARKALEGVLEQLPEGFRPDSLLSLQAELRLEQLLQAAADSERTGKDEEAARLYAQALDQREGILYWDELLAVVGDIEETWRRCQDRAGRRKRALALIAEGDGHLEALDFRAAEAAQLRAIGMSANLPDLLPRSRRAARLASLRGDVQQAASLPGNDDATLAALAVLTREFPNDAWGQETRQQLRAHLLRSLTQDPGSTAGQVLRHWFAEDAEAQEHVERAASLALKYWMRSIERLRPETLQRTPSKLRQAAQALEELRITIERGLLLSEGVSFRAAAGQLLSAIQPAAAQVGEWREQQLHLKEELDRASQTGRPPQGILEAAQRLGIELFDEPELSIEGELRRVREEQVATGLHLYQRYLDIADEAYSRGQIEWAREGYQAVQQADGAPEEVKAYARLALERLESGETPVQQATELARTWRQRIGEMEGLLARMTTLTHQVEAAEAVTRGRRQWRRVLLWGLLAVALLGWLLWSTWISWRMTRELHDLRAMLSLPVTATAAITGPLVTIPTPTATATRHIATPTVKLTTELTPMATGEVIPVSITFVDVPMSLPVGGQTEITVMVQELYRGGAVADGTAVLFEATGGTVDPPAVVTRAGLATTLFTAHPSAIEARVVARVGAEWRGWNIVIQSPSPTPLPGNMRKLSRIAHLGKDDQCTGAAGVDSNNMLIYQLPPGMEVELNPTAGDINAADCVPVKVRVWVPDRVVNQDGAKLVLSGIGVGLTQVRVRPEEVPSRGQAVLPQSLQAAAEGYEVRFPGEPEVQDGYVHVEIWGWMQRAALTS